jgi:hypothetical protein
VGDQVTVSYTDVSGKLMAQEIVVLQPRPVDQQKQK